MAAREPDGTAATHSAATVAANPSFGKIRLLAAHGRRDAAREVQGVRSEGAPGEDLLEANLHILQRPDAGDQGHDRLVK
jgi:hypothetical protein